MMIDVGSLSGRQTILKHQISDDADVIRLQGIRSSLGSRTLRGLVLVALEKLWYSRGCVQEDLVIWREEW